MNPLWYAARSVPAHKRVGAYVADTPGLGLIFKLMRDIPTAHPYVVGGTVRDAILGALPHRTHVLVRDVAPPTLDKFLRTHGTVTQHSCGHWHVTPRGTTDTLAITVPHSRSIDRNGDATRFPAPLRSLHHDLESRDFTINAIAYSIKDGILIDPHNGLHDLLSTQTIRSIHPPTLHLSQEPALIARAIRLASQCHFHLADTLWRVLPHAHTGLLRITHTSDGKAVFSIPRVRLGHDVLLGLAYNPHYLLTLLRESMTAQSLTPDLLQHGSIIHDDGETGWQKTAQLLAALHHHETTKTYSTGKKSVTLLLAGLLALLEERASSALQNMIIKLHLHKVADHRLTFQYLDVDWLLKKNAKLQHVSVEKISPTERERLVRGRRGSELLALFDATLSAQHQHHSLGRENLLVLRAEREHFLNQPAKNELVRGRDLLALGLHSGPHLRSLLAKIRDAQLEGHLSSRGAALDFARYLASQP